MKELLTNPAVVSVLLAGLGYLLKCAISWLVNKYPELRRFKLEEKSKQVIALVDQWIKDQPKPPTKEAKKSKAKEIASLVGIDLDKVNAYRRMIVDGWKNK